NARSRRRSRSGSAAPGRARTPAGPGRPSPGPATRPARRRRRGWQCLGGPRRIFPHRNGKLPVRPSARSDRMNLHRMLAAREAEKRPVRVVLVGAGKFGSMYLSQARRTPGIQVLAVADLAPDRARASLARVGWAPERFAARSFDDALRTGATFVTDDAAGAISHAA